MADEGPPPLPEVPSAPPSLPWFTSVSWKPYHYELYERVYTLIQEKALFYNSVADREQSPYNFKTPEELRKEIDFTLSDSGVDNDKIIEYFEKLVQYSPHRSHPFYLARDGVGLDPYAIAGDFTSNILSTAVLTYLFAPVFTLQEYVVEMSIRKLIGYQNPERGDGVITPGAGFATAMAISAAMNYKYPNIRNKGYGGMDEPVFCVYASENCHEYVEKACIIAGVGTESFEKIRTDRDGRMDTSYLKNRIQRNKSRGTQPLVVIATIGTDPHGAVDNISEIAKICKEFDIWFHVDGSYGGAFIFSDEYRASKLSGIDKSQSFILGGGMLGTPYCFTCMVTPYPDQFFKTFGVGAQVVFEPTLLYDSNYDNGDHTIQTSRRGDVSKLWLMWKVKGKKGIGQHVKYIVDLATQFNEEIKKRSGYHAITSQLDSTRVLFYYILPHLRYSPRRLDYLNYQMSTLSRKIKSKLLMKGTAFLGIAKVRAFPECFAVSVTNSATSLDDLKYVLDEIEGVAKETTKKILRNPWFPVPFRKSKSTGEGTTELTELSASQIGTYASPPPPRATLPVYVNAPIESLHLKLFKRIADLFDAKGLYFQERRKEPLLRFRTPEDLLKEFDLYVRDDPSLTGDDQIIQALENMIRYSIHQAHPFYIYQLLSGGLDPYTIMSDFMLTTMTSNSLTYEDGPLYVLMEEEVLRACRKRIGYPENGDGMLMPGGSIANMVAMLVARLSMYPETKSKGLEGWKDMKLAIYVSANAHYCFQKGALLEGLGLDNVVAVPPDPDGRMDVNELKKAIAQTKQNGGIPYFVGCTAGTTVIGIFDNLSEIYKVCQENKLWMHVDGSVGGAAMFSDFQLKDKLSDVHLSDSMNFNPHKWFGVTQETSILIFKQSNIVEETLGLSQSSKRTVKTFGGERDTTSYDSNKAFGDLAAHAGLGWERRPNILKFWLMWKAKGTKGLGSHIDYSYASRDFLVQELKRPERQVMFRLVKPEYCFQSPGVCFYYLPLALRDLDENSVEFKQRLERVPLPLQARLVKAGVTITPIFRDSGSPLFTKFVVMSSGINTTDIAYLLDAIDYYGRDLPA